MGGCRTDGGAQGAVEGGDGDFEVYDAGVGLEVVGCFIEDGVLSHSAPFLFSFFLFFFFFFAFFFFAVCHFDIRFVGEGGVPQAIEPRLECPGRG